MRQERSWDPNDPGLYSVTAISLSMWQETPNYSESQSLAWKMGVPHKTVRRLNVIT